MSSSTYYNLEVVGIANTVNVAPVVSGSGTGGAPTGTSTTCSGLSANVPQEEVINVVSALASEGTVTPVAGATLLDKEITSTNFVTTEDDYIFDTGTGSYTPGDTLSTSAAWQEVCIGLLPATVPPAPTGLTTGAMTSTTIALTWTNPAGPITAAEVYTAPYVSGSCGGYSANVAATTPFTGATATGLTAGTAYCLEVTVSNSTGASGFSIALTDVVTPHAPGRSQHALSDRAGLEHDRDRPRLGQSVRNDPQLHLTARHGLDLHGDGHSHRHQYRTDDQVPRYGTCGGNDVQFQPGRVQLHRHRSVERVRQRHDQRPAGGADRARGDLRNDHDGLARLDATVGPGHQRHGGRWKGLWLVDDLLLRRRLGDFHRFLTEPRGRVLLRRGGMVERGHGVLQQHAVGDDPQHESLSADGPALEQHRGHERRARVDEPLTRRRGADQHHGLLRCDMRLRRGKRPGDLGLLPEYLAERSRPRTSGDSRRTRRTVSP